LTARSGTPKPGLPDLLGRLDPQAGLVERHLWLIGFFDWVRGDCTSVQACTARLALFLDALQLQPGLAQRAQAWWQTLLDVVDGTTLLADFGFASRNAFMSELAERLRLKCLPATPETVDASELFSLALCHAFDAQWIAAMDGPLLARLALQLQTDPVKSTGNSGPQVSLWQNTVLEAITYCTSQVRATGFAPELRLRMSAAAREAEPFHTLPADFESVRLAFLAHADAGPASDVANNASLQAALAQFRGRLELCRQAASTVYVHLDEHGVSVNLVFRLRQLRERVLRIRALLDCLISADPPASTSWLMSHLVLVEQDRRSIRALVASNSSLLAAKMAERSSEVGEHYITRTRAQYRSMLVKAAGGGALTAVTTWLKFTVMAVGLSAFWSGFWSSFVYAASFVAIQLLQFTLATKQPAMTAPAMAAKLKDLTDAKALDVFVDEVTHLVRSQVAAVLGNVLVVFPVVVLISITLQYLGGNTMIAATDATYVLHSLTLFGPTILFAAFTGILLFSSSLIAGWADNWFVLHRLHSAIRYNPRIAARLGGKRAGRWARFMRENVAGTHAGPDPRSDGFLWLGPGSASRHPVSRAVGSGQRSPWLGGFAK
jgi:site-specific recombinase